jgi:hypothetical protein
MSSFRAIIIPLRHWVKSCTLFLLFRIQGIHIFHTIFTWKSMWISSGITGISLLLQWISGGKVALCHAGHILYARVAGGYIHISTANSACLLFDFERKIRYTTETHNNQELKRFFAHKISILAQRIELMCYNPPSRDMMRLTSEARSEQILLWRSYYRKT